MDFPPGWLLELLKYGGTPILLFVIWIIYNRGENRKWLQIFDSQRQDREQDFQLLRDTIETVQMHTTILARMEQKIDNNTYCPIIRERKS